MYAGWGGWDYDGDGDTYVDNSTSVDQDVNDPIDAEDADNDGPTNVDTTADADDSQPETVDNPYAAASPNSTRRFPVDDWPELGVATYAGEYGKSQGQVVVRVVPGSAADKAGFVPGDVILTLNGQPVPSADALDTVLDTAGGKFEAEVWDARTGRTSTLTGPLDAGPPATAQPVSRDTAATSPQPR